MKIKLRLLCLRDALQTLKTDSVVSKVCDLDSVVFELDSEDEILDRILALTKNSSGIWFNTYMHFTQKEISHARYFQLEPRKLVYETEKDYELNFSRLAKVPSIRTRSKCEIKLLDSVALSKIKLKKNMVAGIDEWTAEFVITSEVAAIFHKNGLTGFDLKQVYNPKTGKDYEDYFLLYSDNILPLIELDSTIVDKGNEEECFRSLGCLVYDFQSEEMLKDFNRTAENLSSNFMPLWVVSATVRDCFLRNKCKGGAFLPVMEKGRKMYEDYSTKWQSLIQRVSINPKNTF